MRAVLKTRNAPGLELGDVPAPQAGPVAVVIRVEAASVCGTDVSLAHWTRSAQDFHPVLPLVMGHAFYGAATEVGDGVTSLALNERFAVESHYFCGTCAACHHDARHNCLAMRIPGITAPGAFTEFVAVPASACFRLRAGVDPMVGALYELAGVAAHAIEQTGGDVAGRTIALTGARPVGLFLIALLRAAGAGPIAMMEPSPLRRQRASELGAETFTTDQADRFTAFCWERGSIAGADVGVELSGSVAAFPTLFDALGRDATHVTVGHPSQELPLDVARNVNKRMLTWRGVFGRHIWSSWEFLDGLVGAGAVDLASFIELEIGLDELPDRIEEIAALSGKCIVRP